MVSKIGVVFGAAAVKVTPKDGLKLELKDEDGTTEQ